MALTVMLVVITLSILLPAANGQQPVTVTRAFCAEYGAVERDRRCIYPALADCRRKPSATSSASLFQCPTNTTCEPTTGLCVCAGQYQNINDRDGILTCIRGQAYGAPCSQAYPCLNPLTCSSSGTCDCPASSIWNPAESRCYDDRVCSSQRRGTFYEPESHSCKCILDQSDCLGRGTQCPMNGRIHREFQNLLMVSMCRCSSGFAQTEDKKRCVRPKSYGESCNTANGEMCNSDALLSCDNGTCICDAYSKLWDPASDSCKLKAGRLCNLDSSSFASLLAQGNCGSRAVCQRPSNASADEGSQCICSPGYGPNAEGRCAGVYRTQCTSREECLEGFDCMEGICDCRDRINKVYDPNNKGNQMQCKNAVSSRCTNNSSCVAYSHCNSARVCECDEGYKEGKETSTVTGLCVPAFGYGSRCSSGQCDSEKGLACRSGSCECADSALVYKGKEQGCLATLGSKCGIRQFENVHYAITCDRPGVCRPASSSTATPSMSVCVAG